MCLAHLLADSITSTVLLFSQCPLAVAVYPSCTEPCPSPFLWQSHFCSLILVPAPTGDRTARPCLLPVWTLRQCIPQHLLLPALAWVAFGPWLWFLCLMVQEWAGRDPLASWAAQRANLPRRAQSTCVPLVYTGFLCLIFGLFL